MPSLLVVGFHRSGTSSCAEWLHRAGVVMGTSFLPAQFSNPRGHFEDWNIVAFHDRVLRRAGTTWQYHDEVPLALTESERNELHELAASRARQYPLWGFKDPRTTLFLDEWLATAEDTYALLLYRHWTECLHSLFTRHAIALGAGSAGLAATDLALFRDPELGLRAWASYNRRLLAAHAASPGRCLLISHGAVLGGYPMLEKIRRRTGIELTESTPSVVNKRLVHEGIHSAVPSWINDSLRRQLDEVWETLQHSADAPATPTTRPVARRPALNTLRTRFEELIEEPRQERLPPTDVEVSSPSSWREYGKELLRAEAPIEAFECARRAHDLEPDDAATCALLGEALLQLCRFAEAAEKFRRAATLAPQRGDYFAGAAEASLRMHDMRAAEQFLEQAFACNRNNPHFWVVRARLQYHRGDVEGGRQALLHAIELRPNQRDALLEITSLLEQEENLEAALAQVHAALVAHPHDFSVRRRHVALLFSAQRPDDGHRELSLLVRRRLKTPVIRKVFRHWLDSLPDHGATVWLDETLRFAGLLESAESAPASAEATSR